MNNSTMAFIEYASQFVITDVTRLVIVIGGIGLVVGIILLFSHKKKT